jgi:hypothetical protein
LRSSPFLSVARGFEEEVVVIAHEHEGMHPPAGPSTGFTQRLQEPLPLPVVAEDRFAPVSAIEHMVERSGEFDAGFAGHATGLPQAAAPVHPQSEIHRLTPLLMVERPRGIRHGLCGPSHGTTVGRGHCPPSERDSQTPWASRILPMPFPEKHSN